MDIFFTVYHQTGFTIFGIIGDIPTKIVEIHFLKRLSPLFGKIPLIKLLPDFVSHLE